MLGILVRGVLDEIGFCLSREHCYTYRCLPLLRLGLSRQDDKTAWLSQEKGRTCNGHLPAEVQIPTPSIRTRPSAHFRSAHNQVRISTQTARQYYVIEQSNVYVSLCNRLPCWACSLGRWLFMPRQTRIEGEDRLVRLKMGSLPLDLAR
jgi:hypothetical protein